MALDINGYNATFKAFTDFATQSVEAGKSKAVAELGGRAAEGPLAGRTIQASTIDRVGTFIRFQDLKDENNDVRTLFRDAVAELFGGESNIPKSVLDAMKLQDYGKGKPLTARRIIAVKNAIDASGVLQQKAFEASISTFKSADVTATALAKGYSKEELPKLAKAANLFAQATGCSEAKALEEVTTPGSKANRLMNYGGRFLQSADNFKNGLRLLDSFGTWYDETHAALSKIHQGTKSHYAGNLSKTLLNAQGASQFRDVYKPGIEKFVFEELAQNPSMDLSETDPDKLFGMENNTAMSCLGRNFHSARTQTFSQIPPEKRTVFFKAVSVLCPLYASNAEQANVPPAKRKVLKHDDIGYVTGRILKNFGQVAALAEKGELTQANLAKLCFPEIKNLGPDPQADVKDLTNQWYVDSHNDPLTDAPGKYPEDLSETLQNIMEGTGCSIEEAFQMANGGKQIPNVQYYSSGTLSLRAVGGSLDEARDQLAGDLGRPSNYSYKDSPKTGIMKDPDSGFRFNFPDGQSHVANNSEKGRAAIQTIMEKLESLCGGVHPQQASSLMMATSQSGLASLRGALSAYGIISSEHAAVDFTVSKNDTTGDITVRYSSPKELPFAFEWTATIKPDGYVSTTPFRFTDETTLKNEMAAAAEKLNKDVEVPDREPEARNKALDVLLSGARGDRDLLALLQADNSAMAKSVIINAANQVRSPAKVSQMIEELRGNLNELRTAANGNPRIFNVGLKRLPEFGGKAIRSGILTKMCDLIAKEDLGAFRNISAASSPQDIFKAMCRLDSMVERIFDKTKIMMTLGEVGQAESIFARKLVMGLIFAHCDENTCNGLKSALTSENGMTMTAVLDKLDKGLFPDGTNIAPDVRIDIADSAATFHMTFRYEMYGTLNEALGIETDYMPEPPDESLIPPGRTVAAMLDTIERHTLEMNEWRRARPNLGARPQGAQ